MNINYHFNLIKKDFTSAVEVFDWESQQTRLALKTAFACVLAVTVTAYLEINHAFWAGISTIIMMRPHVIASWQKGWQRAGGACIGCIFSLFLTSWTVQSPLAYTLSIFLISIAAFYLGTRREDGYFWTYMGLHIVMISMMSMLDPYECKPVYTAFYRGAAVSIGVLCSWFVNIVLWPDFIHEEHEQASSDLQRKAFVLLAEIIEKYIENDFKLSEIHPKCEKLIKEINYRRALSGMVRVEKKLLGKASITPESILHVLPRHLEAMISFLENAEREKGKNYQLNYAPWLKRIQKSLMECSEIDFNSKNDFSRIIHETELEISEIEERYEEIKPKVNPDHSIHEVIQFLDLTNKVKNLLNDLKTNHENEDLINKDTDPSRMRTRDPDWSQWSFPKTQISIHLPTLRYSIKASLGIVGVFWLWLWFEIPGGLNMTVAVVTVMQLDLMTTYHKGLLRFLGCLLGAACGLFLLFCGLESTILTYLALFWFVFGFAYIWGSKPGVAYIGAQASIAFLVCIVHSSGPIHTLAPVIERLVGIFLGVLSVWGINLILWPEDLLKQLRGRSKLMREFIAAYGQEISDSWRKNHPHKLDTQAARILLNDIEDTVKVLLEQGEISRDFANESKNWNNQIEALLDDLKRLSSVTPNVCEFFYQLQSDLFDETMKLVTASSSSELNEKNQAELIKQARNLKDKNWRLRADMRDRGLIKQKDIEFKMNAASFLLAHNSLLANIQNIPIPVNDN